MKLKDNYDKQKMKFTLSKTSGNKKFLSKNIESNNILFEDEDGRDDGANYLYASNEEENGVRRMMSKSEAKIIARVMLKRSTILPKKTFPRAKPSIVKV